MIASSTTENTGVAMEFIQDWKALQRMGNNEFEQQRWRSASRCYWQSILLLRPHLPQVLLQRPEEADQIIICLSIAVQNLSDAYCRQDRVNQSVGLLKRAQRECFRLLETHSLQHPVVATLLRELCQLRKLLCTCKAGDNLLTPLDNLAMIQLRKPANSRLH